MNTRYNLKNVCQQLSLEGKTESIRKKYRKEFPHFYGQGHILGEHGIHAFCLMVAQDIEQLESWLDRFGISYGQPNEDENQSQLYLMSQADAKRYRKNWEMAERSLEEAGVRHEEDLEYHKRDKVRMREERDKAREEVRLLRQALERVTDELVRVIRLLAERLGLEPREAAIEADLSEDSIDLF